MASYWLMKTEPGTYSFSQLLKDGKTNWSGVRNFQARNNLAAIKKGDVVLIYHSGDDKSVVGIAKVVREGYPDPNPKKKGEWVQVDLEPVEELGRPVALSEIKATRELKDMMLVKHSRLSVMPISGDHYKRILKMGELKSVSLAAEPAQVAVPTPAPAPAPAPDWAPFDVAPASARPEPPRKVDTLEGIGDRIRTAAFAELQAREAFNWGALNFADAPAELRGAWRSLAHAEEKHLGWLLKRAEELGVNLRERQVSDQLWQSLVSCKTAREFAIYMASAEERGRRAGDRFAEAMRECDPESARIFGQIALEERAHIELALKFYPDNARRDLAYGLHKGRDVELGSTPWPGG